MIVNEYMIIYSFSSSFSINFNLFLNMKLYEYCSYSLYLSYEYDLEP